MKLRALHQETASQHADVERRPVPRVAVVRRIESSRPSRVWSLLLPPSFQVGGPKALGATDERGSPGTARRPRVTQR